MYLIILNILGGKEEELDSDDLDDDYDDDDEEEEEEVVNATEEGSSGPAEMSAAETLNSLKSYMDQMDQELQSTNVGKSFSQTVNTSFYVFIQNLAGLKYTQAIVNVWFLQNYKACVNNDSSGSPTGNGLSMEEGGVDEAEEEIQPLDIDVNLVANLLESLSSQAGLAGPASNLLQSLGIQLPPNSDPS